jgi:hypothetical protein
VAANYYVSAGGNDKWSGSIVDPWKTIARVNKGTYSPGDHIFFQGGTTFNGNLAFTSASAGTSTNPIVITTYGSTPAIISAGNSYGLMAYNTAGFSISNINFVGAGASSNTQSGVLFYTDLPGNTKLNTLRIDQVDVSGFSSGITIGAWNGLTGYQNVSITSTAAHDNAQYGVVIYGYTSSTLVGYANQNVYIGHVQAYGNLGLSGTTKPSGNGIVVGNSDGVVIERSLAYNNGVNNTHNGGPVGIWAWDSNNVVIQYNESHHNHTGSTADGGGFDLDGGSTNSVFQYNYSHDNDGPGFLFCEYAGARAWRNNTIRYNISQNDGRKNGAGGINLFNSGTGIQGAQIFNNTVYMSSAVTTPAVLRLQTATTNVAIRNNIFFASSGVPVLRIASGQTGLLLQDNNYWAGGAAVDIVWAGKTFNNLNSFRSATGQETYNGTAVGSSVDPQLKAPGSGWTIDDPDMLNSLTAYSLETGSPMIDTAMNLSVLFGINPGPNDFIGNATPRGLGYDVGALEY